MQFFDQFLPESFASATGQTIMHSLWEIALLGLVLLVLLTVFRKAKARVRYHLALGTLMLMLAAPVVTFLKVWEAETPMTEIAVLAVTPAPLVTTAVAESSFETGTESMLVDWKSSISSFFQEHASLIAGIWLMGILLLLLQRSMGLYKVRKLRTKGTFPVPDRVRREMTFLKHQLGIKRPVTILQSSQIQVPLTMGSLKPVILLPMGMLAGLSTEQVECIILHELAHIRRWDYLVNLMQTFAETLLFFHPAVWWVSRTIREERENCCDEIVITQNQNYKMAYAHALVNLEALRSRTVRFAMASSGGALFKRIKRITGKGHGRPNYHRGVLALLILTALLFVVTTGSMKPVLADETIAEAGPLIQMPMMDPFEQGGGPDKNIIAVNPVNDEDEIRNTDRRNDDELMVPPAPGEPEALAAISPLRSIIVTANQLENLKNYYRFVSLPNYCSQVDTPVIQVTILDEGKKVELKVRQSGSIESIKVDGKEIPKEDYSQYDAYTKKVLKDYIADNKRASNSRNLSGFNFNFNRDWDNMSEEDMEKFEEEMEVFAEKMERWGEEFGRKMEKQFNSQNWEECGEDWEEFGERMEKWGEEFGERMEKWGEDFGEQMEDKFESEEFQQKMEEFGENFGKFWEEEGDDLTEQLAELGTRIAEEVERAMDELQDELDDQQDDMDRKRRRMDDREEEIREEAEERRERAMERAEEARERAEEARERAEDRREEARERAERARERERDKNIKSRWQRFEKRLETEMVRDGLIRAGESYSFKINEKNLKVNGKKQRKDLYYKYLRLLEQSTGKKYKGNFSVSIEEKD